MAWILCFIFCVRTELVEVLSVNYSLCFRKFALLLPAAGLTFVSTKVSKTSVVQNSPSMAQTVAPQHPCKKKQTIKLFRFLGFQNERNDFIRYSYL